MLLRGATILTRWSNPDALAQADVRIQDGVIAEIGPNLTPLPGEPVTELGGGLLAPSFVCGHTHLYSALARGMPPASATPPNGFLEILDKVWWKLDRALDADSVRASARMGALDALRCGTTGLIDHHASPNFVDGSLDVVADNLRDIGVRGLLCYETSDRDGEAIRDAGLQENARFIRRGSDKWTAGMLGAHASFTLGDDSLDALGDLAQSLDAGLHIHVAEGTDDRQQTRQRYGADLLGRMADRGLLRPGTILAHCVDLTDSEIAQAAEAGCHFAHNPSSNLNNRVGFSPLWQRADAVVLGTDGIGADMYSEAKMAWFRGTEATGALSPGRVAQMLDASADLLYCNLGMKGGAIVPGFAADLQWLNYDSPTPLTADTIAGHLLFGMGSQFVQHVWSGGRQVLKSGEFCALDEAAERHEGRVQAKRLWAGRVVD
ncbi:MAG: amidohydrolase family protein [Myxococcales bacterium]|nr:amidohydrolase family protein [Myxococcales bacterium]